MDYKLFTKLKWNTGFVLVGIILVISTEHYSLEYSFYSDLLLQGLNPAGHVKLTWNKLGKQDLVFTCIFLSYIYYDLSIQC